MRILVSLTGGPADDPFHPTQVNTAAQIIRLIAILLVAEAAEPA